MSSETSSEAMVTAVAVCTSCGLEMADAAIVHLAREIVCEDCTARCVNCGVRGIMADMHEHNDRYYCGDCVMTCEDCGNACNDDYSNVNDTIVCGVCLESNYRYSEYQDRYIPRGDAVRAVDADGCQTWLDGDCIPDGFTYCDDCGRYEHTEYRCQRTPRVIHSYHNGPKEPPVVNAWSATHSRRYFGVELEVECKENGNAEERAAHVLSAHSAIAADILRDAGTLGDSVLHMEYDGSLVNGFEIITRPMGLPAHRVLWDRLLTPDNMRGLKSHASGRCGLHVHVSRASLSRFQIAKMNAFLNDPDNERLVRAIARRYSGDYCHVNPKPFAPNDPRCRMGNVGRAIYGNGRYDALNVGGRITIECRIFRGSLKADAVIAAVEWVHAMCDFCADSSGVGLLLTADNFLRFIQSDAMRADTRRLRAYLATRGYAELETPARRTV